MASNGKEKQGQQLQTKDQVKKPQTEGKNTSHLSAGRGQGSRRPGR